LVAGAGGGQILDRVGQVERGRLRRSGHSAAGEEQRGRNGSKLKFMQGTHRPLSLPELTRQIELLQCEWKRLANKISQVRDQVKMFY
jgi:hypothetical protein